MPDFKPWQWATLIALLATLNIVVVGGLILVIVTYDMWTNPTYLAAEPTVPPWASPTATQRPTFTPTFTPEVWPTATVTRTPTRTPTPTSTWTPLPTRTPWWTVTPTPDQPPTGMPTVTPSQAPTRTPLPPSTPTPLLPTDTSTPTKTPLPPTNTPVPTRTPVPSTSTPTPTYSPFPTSTPLPTLSQTPMAGPSPTLTHTRPPTSTPSPSPTHTPSPTRTDTPAPSPSPTYTPTPSPSPSATATPTLTVTKPPSPVADLSPLEATSLAEEDIKLSWESVAHATVYRVYSDMGTGYGIYLFKAETDGQELTDNNLRPGLRYQYRIRSVTPEGELVLARASALTPYRPALPANERSPLFDTGITAQPVRSSIRVTPAPTPLPPDTVILGLLSANDYADDVEDTLTIVGEVRNDSHLDVGDTTVTATFYTIDGQVIGEASSPTMLRSLLPGARSPFVITLPRPPGLENYSMRATGRPITSTSTDVGLNVVNTRRFEDPAGFYHVAGVIENPGERRIEGARVVVTLYDRAGRVINVGFAYPQPSSLSPKDRADFDVAFTYYPKVFSHTAIALEN
jgi:hypothetical protein